MPLAPPVEEPLLSSAVAPPKRIRRRVPSPETAVNVCPQRLVGAEPSAGMRAHREKTTCGESISKHAPTYGEVCRCTSEEKRLCRI